MHKEDIMLALIKQGKFRWSAGYDLVGPRMKDQYTTHCGGYSARTFRHGGKKYNVLVHRLVYRQFVGPIPPGMTVNHKNGNKLDNNPKNLELMTVGENTLHGLDALGLRRSLSKKHSGSRNPNAKFCDTDIKHLRDLYQKGASLRSIAEEYNVSHTIISRIVRNVGYPCDKYAQVLYKKGRSHRPNCKGGRRHQHSLPKEVMIGLSEERKTRSYAELARKYGLTRHQVIGICRRNEGRTCR